MKNIKNYLLLALALILINCSKDDDDIRHTVQQTATSQLSVTWGSAQVIDSPVSGAAGTLDQLILTFGATENLQPASFSASGAPEFFSTNNNSSWSWENQEAIDKVVLSNVSGVQEITIEELTETNLTISFLYEGSATGKLGGIGLYRVEFLRE